MKAFRYIFLVLCAISWMPATTQAQLTFGFGAGLNYTSIDDVAFESVRTTYENHSGYHFGIFLDFGAGPLALRPGVYYINEGSLLENGLPEIAELTDNFDLTYIVVPIDVRFRSALPFIKPYVYAGPELRFQQDIDQKLKEILDMRSFNLAGSVGGGLELNVAGLNLIPEVRYTFDISGITGDTFTIGGVEFNPDDSLKRRSLVLRLGIAF